MGSWGERRGILLGGKKHHYNAQSRGQRVLFKGSSWSNPLPRCTSWPTTIFLIPLPRMRKQARGTQQLNSPKIIPVPERPKGYTEEMSLKSASLVLNTLLHHPQKPNETSSSHERRKQRELHNSFCPPALEPVNLYTLTKQPPQIEPTIDVFINSSSFTSRSQTYCM